MFRLLSARFLCFISFLLAYAVLSSVMYGLVRQSHSLSFLLHKHITFSRFSRSFGTFPLIQTVMFMVRTFYDPMGVILILLTSFHLACFSCALVHFVCTMLYLNVICIIISWVLLYNIWSLYFLKKSSFRILYLSTRRGRSKADAPTCEFCLIKRRDNWSRAQKIWLVRFRGNNLGFISKIIH